MDKELFRKTEGRLYRYFKQLKLIEKLKNKVVLLYKQQEAIKQEIHNLKNLKIETGLNMGIDYSRDKIQSSSDGSGEAERETIKYIENLEKEYRYVVKKMLKINARIREIEIQIQDMQYNLSMLSEESKRFIEWKYAELKSIDWIAVEMYGGARSTAYRKREELVENIANYSNILV
ncbi:hypothetical protein SAMN02745163_02071 [Clostridium cavendishii DSM 21758]|uniref:Phage transcriptional activator, RinA family n=1 Tax=Clostridium cavendishii DSM 21758 TaxID=1121302 RepID=A0A1M6K149_9CLOT|nr:hypothetical protein [Clostridium cavendishii]SHJ52711.1 hypothetical protein SAMN02745163_02071 [Clostridium cavendishii DSM 21758]